MTKKHLFRQLQIKVRPKGLHSFTFYILIFDFPSHLPIMSLSASIYMRKWSLYICRDTFTDVMSALQIKLFMQNKANFRKVKLNVNEVLTKDYVQMDTWSIGKTKPIQSQLKPIQSQFKPNQSQFLSAISVAGQTANLLANPMLYNYLLAALFPLTSSASRHYNGIFSQLSCFWSQMKGFGNE